MTRDLPPPKVFISYSHDFPEHKRWVCALASELRRNGVDTTLDQWDLLPGADVAQFMEEGLRDSWRVLVICSEAYVRKSNARSGGVGYETMIVSNELIQDLGSTRFIPLIRQRGNVELPTALATRRYIDFSDDASYADSIEELLRELHGAPAIRKPPLGRNPFGGDSIPRSNAARIGTTLPLASTVRTAVLRIPREHTDAERDAFLEDTFELMAHSFEEGLVELQDANPYVQTRFKRIDARQFSAVVYRNGRAENRCRVRLNPGGYRFGGGITYSNEDSDRNSFNEQLSVQSDGTSLFLRPLGMTQPVLVGHNTILNAEQAAELYWNLLIDPLTTR